jgi:1-acyl-sn-glycerol-3-phosphate acyltransferase
MFRGLGIVLLLIGNLIIWGTLVALGGIVKFAVQLIAPRSRLRSRVILTLASFGDRWVAGNNRIFDRMLAIEYDVAGIPDVLPPNGHYLLISNHISWVDILVLQRVFHGRIAFIRFFLKQELIWFPILGQACWALEFPFMKRYSSEYLKEHPEKRGEDLASTRRACQRYRHLPVTIANFSEGTRFSQDKREEQDSPYRNLLRPRVGGIAYVLASLGDQLDAVLDVTLAYSTAPSMWGFVTGKMKRIFVRVRQLDVPAEFFTAGITEPGTERDHFKTWIEEVWRAKDEVIDRL